MADDQLDEWQALVPPIRIPTVIRSGAGLEEAIQESRRKWVAALQEMAARVGITIDEVPPHLDDWMLCSRWTEKLAGENCAPFVLGARAVEAPSHVCEPAAEESVDRFRKWYIRCHKTVPPLVHGEDEVPGLYLERQVPGVPGLLVFVAFRTIRSRGGKHRKTVQAAQEHLEMEVEAKRRWLEEVRESLDRFEERRLTETVKTRRVRLKKTRKKRRALRAWLDRSLRSLEAEPGLKVLPAPSTGPSFWGAYQVLPENPPSEGADAFAHVAQEIKAWYVRTLKGKPASRGRKRGEAHVLESVYPHLADAIADVEATGRASAEELVNALHARGIDVDKQLVEYWETRGYLIRQGRGWVVRFPL